MKHQFSIETAGIAQEEQNSSRDNTLNIVKSEFIKIEKLSNIKDEENLTLMSINIIKTDEIDENDKKNSFLKIFETDKNKVNKNDQH